MMHGDKMTIAGQQYKLSVPIRERLRDALRTTWPDGSVVEFEQEIEAQVKSWLAYEEAVRRLWPEK